jgi:Flp pilus assembly pilin Flp
MFRLFVCFGTWIRRRSEEIFERLVRMRPALTTDAGQTTAEYALVILAAAAVALVLIAWAQSSGKLPAFFDKVIDKLTSGF